MAQVPAVPKLTRARHLLRSTPFGKTTPTADMVASERAALALRRAALRQQTADHVTFLIPLVGAHHVGDWDAVTARLSTTLQSFLRQDNPHWQAVICCQDRPTLPDDPRIRYLPFDDPAPGNDKWRKLRVLAEALPDLVRSPGYVMSFDADDLLRQGSVDEMLTRQAAGGYLVESGLVMDVATGDIALADHRSWAAPMRKPFWKLCGSCAALYHDPASSEATAFLAEMTQHEHRMFPYLAALAGQPLHPLNRPSVLYMLNHGENFGARRGRVGYKTRFVQSYRIDEPEALATIRSDFGL
ncbi:glycosyltransferase family protein [Marivita geojedonensis]|uniref:Glycosyl transferase n=1 Tax=Marivita geojedonensis TaxID=1123756 RepID=A0A1X4NN49_9RHOB|nr:hypothetical protein [Marivita geojedonensis]OSQ51708.1 hypothetical protein MGEO_07295 [Marivita geojedonensis]PRY79257.1 hypothetical protein CLV76_105153 [Marivita geojedonensis]